MNEHNTAKLWKNKAVIINYPDGATTMVITYSHRRHRMLSPFGVQEEEYEQMYSNLIRCAKKSKEQ